MDTNFPSGFDGGVTLKNVPVEVNNPSIVYWVGNNPVMEVNEKTASNSNSGTYSEPFSTIDYAIGMCNAGNDNTIMVREGYTQTIVAASGITCDVAGVKIIGVGNGNDRPTITFGTLTTASILITAANTTISNIIGKSGIDGLTQPFDVRAAGCTLDIEWQDASSLVEAATAILTTSAADNLNINLKYIGFPAGNAAVSAIVLVGVNNAKINVDAYGIFSTAIVNFLTTSCTNIEVTGYFYNSGTTNFSKNVVDTVGTSTWFVAAYDGAAGGAFSGGSGAAIASDDITGVYTALGTNGTTVTDSATTVLGAIGANNADNAFSSSTVVANRDGSVLERLESLMDPLGAYDPLLGFRVTKTSNMADGSGTDNLFTVTGRCLITHFSGEVTTVIGTTTTMKIRDVTNSVDLCAATTITTDAVGTMYSLTSITANILNGTGATPVIGSVPNITGALPMPMAIVGDSQAALTLAHVLDGAGTGAVAWVLYYKPLTATSSIAAAA